MNIHKFNAKPKTISPQNDSMASDARGKISGSKIKSDDLGNF